MRMSTSSLSQIALDVSTERFPIAGKFTIARGSKTEAAVVTVHLRANGRQGQGECVPYSRYGETLENVTTAIEKIRPQLERGLSRAQLQSLMPAGAARNAVDCALWDLEAKLSGTPAYLSAGLKGWKKVPTAYTISLDTPEAMGEAARKSADRPILKIKLGSPEGDFARIKAVRANAPNASVIADANEGWTPENLQAHLDACADAKFSLIEQPLPAKADEFLQKVKRSVPVCADESVHDRASLVRLVGLYDYVNIKLDKTGGLTEALALKEEAQAHGLGIMVGCMVGSSLAMAPAMVLAMDAGFVDLDGPLLLARDRENGIIFEGSLMNPPSRELWG